MGNTLSDGAKIAITMVIVCSIIAMIVTVAVFSNEFGVNAAGAMNPGTFIDHTADFEAMAVYGDKIPMANVVAALEIYGEPMVLCLQMEDLKGTMGGTPYPVAECDTPAMKTLLMKMRNYFSKEVYVYTYTGNGGNLQLCVSELPHSSNPDGNSQSWEIR